MRRMFLVGLMCAVGVGPLMLRAQDAVPAAQSNASGPYTIHRNVTLVTLDGVALDAQGHLVTDLKESDFHVSEDDAPQRIRFFTVPGETMPAPDVTINSTADLERLAPRAPVNIFVLDEYSTHFEDMAFARYSLKKWLEKQPDKLDSPTMIVAVDIQHFTVVRDYTQDKQDLIRSLDKHLAVYPWTSTNLSWSGEMVGTAYNTLRRVAEGTASHAGHKNVLWLGRGFPLQSRTGTSHIDSSIGHNSSWEQLTMDELRSSRVTLYTIDPAGVMIDPQSYARDDWNIARFGGSPGFEQLARLTGGFGIHGRNDVDAEIGTTVRDGASLYSLTYAPSNAMTGSTSFRRIRVTVDRPGVTFLTHRGYYPVDTPARPSTDGSAGTRLSQELLNAIDSNMTYDAVGFSATAEPQNPHVIAIHVQSKGLAYYFADGGRPRSTRVIVMAKTTDAKGKELWKDAFRFEFVAPADVDARSHLDLPVNMAVPLPDNPKAVHARFVVRVETSGRMGTADMNLGPNAVAQSSSFMPGPEAVALLPVEKAANASAAPVHP
jgi:VWFA-related protein